MTPAWTTFIAAAERCRNDGLKGADRLDAVMTEIAERSRSVRFGLGLASESAGWDLPDQEDR
ncbi:MAG: hypothetical protein CMN94_08980 [Synechococcus sp. EAC657]|nr:hypothetical protein [Synechococcus sp. EAC657]